MIKDLVSTIIPVFNRPVMLREAVESVLAQTWRPIEIIIVDDASTDTTLTVANEFSLRYPDIVRVLQQSNSGPGVARQTGLEAARGEFVQFLDSDDLLQPEKFMLQVAQLRADPEAGISYAKTYRLVGGERVEHPEARTRQKFSSLFPALLEGRIWETIAPLYRRSVLREIGPWPSKRQLEDWEYDAQAGARRVKLSYVDEYVAISRDHGDDRLCHRWVTDLSAMRDRTLAYVAVHRHALDSGIPLDCQEYAQFARSLFWMARNSGWRGLTTEADELLRLARTIPQPRVWDIRLFAVVVALVGWKRAGRWAEALRRP